MTVYIVSGRGTAPRRIARLLTCSGKPVPDGRVERHHYGRTPMPSWGLKESSFNTGSPHESALYFRTAGVQEYFPWFVRKQNDTVSRLLKGKIVPLCFSRSAVALPLTSIPTRSELVRYHATSRTGGLSGET